MKRVRHALNSVSKKTLLCSFVFVLGLSLLVPSIALSENGQADRQKIVNQVVDKWIQIGLEQYDQGFYQAAERSFLRAKSFEDHLDAAKRSQIEELLAKVKNASAAAQKAQVSKEQAKIAAIYNQSVYYYNNGQIEEARKGFLKVSASGLMVAPEGKRAEDYLKKIDEQLMAQQGQPVVEKPAQSPVSEPAVVPETAPVTEQTPVSEESTVPQQTDVTQEPAAAVEDTLLAAPDNTSVGVGTSSEPQTQPVVTAQPASAVQPVSVQPQMAASADQQQGGYIEVIKQKQSILKSHANAVVNDALSKARGYSQKNEHDQAIKALDYAQAVINKNRLHLGEDMFKQYSDQLQNQRQQVLDAQAAYKQNLVDQQRAQAIIEQGKIRTKMAQERAQRVNELMENARAYQKQQRYEEALGQLNSLLTIDPLNNSALIMKDTLTDTIAFRKQLEVLKEREREREKLLLETTKAEIPYASELVYPKNWLEISAKRKPEEAIGHDRETEAVYKQLDQIVDLSNLNRDMPLSEAIEVLRTSVDPPLRIFVNWKDLYDNADIDKTTAIDMDPISAIKLSSALKLLLEAVSGGFAELGYGIESGVITIATKESIPSEMVTMVYDISDLIIRPAEYRIQQQSGGGGGAGGSVSDIGGGFTDSGSQDQNQDISTLREERTGRTSQIIQLIQQTVAPDSWYDVGGEGEITSYGSKMLSIRQTAEVHNEITKLFKELRKAQGYQIAIEAKFLKVRENFLEDIGLDIDFLFTPGGKFSQISFTQSSSDLSQPSSTGVEGTLAGSVASTLAGGYGTILDDLQVSFLLRATQAKNDSVLITAPKATVLSGQSATFRSQKVLYYAGDIDVETRESTGTTGRTSFNVNYDDRSVTSGTTLNITPTISADKKHVLLNIEVQLDDFLGFRRQVIDLPVFGDVAGGGGQYSIDFPQTEVSRVETSVSVPDGATLLLGGQKLGADVETESGVPVLSKIPVLGRAFSNRGKVRDHKILLIMVKPTIILNEETEAEAVANLKNSY